MAHFLSASSPAAVAALVAANLYPLAGILFLGWDLFLVMFLYWIENAIVGIFAVWRMLYAAGTAGAFGRRSGRAPRIAGAPPTAAVAEEELRRPAGAPGPDGDAGPAEAASIRLPPIASLRNLPTIFFFLFHYGFFWLIHGIFVLALFAGKGRLSREFAPPFGAVIALPEVLSSSGLGLVIAVLSLAASHGVSFVSNYLGRREYLRTNFNTEMARPYGRVFLLHVALIAGGFGLVMLGAPAVGLVVFVLLKTAFDLLAHLAEHRKRAGT